MRDHHQDQDLPCKDAAVVGARAAGPHLEGLVSSLLVLVLAPQLQVVLADVDELAVVVLAQVLHHVLVDRVGEQDHLQALLFQPLQEGGLQHLLLALACSQPPDLL